MQSFAAFLFVMSKIVSDAEAALREPLGLVSTAWGSRKLSLKR
jgi:hypothetical protein